MDAEILIFDAQGRIVLESGFTNGRIPVGAAGLARGVYFFQVLTEGRLYGSGKLVVQ